MRALLVLFVLLAVVAVAGGAPLPEGSQVEVRCDDEASEWCSRVDGSTLSGVADDPEVLVVDAVEGSKVIFTVSLPEGVEWLLHETAFHLIVYAEDGTLAPSSNPRFSSVFSASEEYENAFSTGAIQVPLVGGRLFWFFTYRGTAYTSIEHHYERPQDPYAVVGVLECSFSRGATVANGPVQRQGQMYAPTEVQVAPHPNGGATVAIVPWCRTLVQSDSTVSGAVQWSTNDGMLLNVPMSGERIPQESFMGARNATGLVKLKFSVLTVAGGSFTYSEEKFPALPDAVRTFYHGPPRTVVMEDGRGSVVEKLTVEGFVETPVDAGVVKWKHEPSFPTTTEEIDVTVSVAVVSQSGEVPLIELSPKDDVPVIDNGQTASAFWYETTPAGGAGVRAGAGTLTLSTSWSLVIGSEGFGENTAAVAGGNTTVTVPVAFQAHAEVLGTLTLALGGVQLRGEEQPANVTVGLNETDLTLTATATPPPAEAFEMQFVVSGALGLLANADDFAIDIGAGQVSPGSYSRLQALRVGPFAVTAGILEPDLNGGAYAALAATSKGALLGDILCKFAPAEGLSPVPPFLDALPSESDGAVGTLVLFRGQRRSTDTVALSCRPSLRIESGARVVIETSAIGVEMDTSDGVELFSGPGHSVPVTLRVAPETPAGVYTLAVSSSVPDLLPPYATTLEVWEPVEVLVEGPSGSLVVGAAPGQMSMRMPNASDAFRRVLGEGARVGVTLTPGPGLLIRAHPDAAPSSALTFLLNKRGDTALSYLSAKNDTAFSALGDQFVAVSLTQPSPAVAPSTSSVRVLVAGGLDPPAEGAASAFLEGSVGAFQGDGFTVRARPAPPSSAARVEYSCPDGVTLSHIAVESLEPLAPAPEGVLRLVAEFNFTESPPRKFAQDPVCDVILLVGNASVQSAYAPGTAGLRFPVRCRIAPPKMEMVPGSLTLANGPPGARAAKPGDTVAVTFTVDGSADPVTAASVQSAWLVANTSQALVGNTTEHDLELNEHAPGRSFWAYQCESFSVEAGAVGSAAATLSCGVPSRAAGSAASLVAVLGGFGVVGAVSTDTVGFEPPVLTDGTLKLWQATPASPAEALGASLAPVAVLGTKNPDGDTLSFAGTSLGGRDSLVLAARAGAADPVSEGVACNIVNASETQITCQMPPGQTRQDLHFTVVNADQSGTGADSYSYIVPPVVNAVTGCARAGSVPPGCDAAEAADNGSASCCSTHGGDTLTVRGKFFPLDAIVTVDGIAAAMLLPDWNTSRPPQSYLECVVPPSTGSRRTLVVSGTFEGIGVNSKPAQLVSFSPPRIYWLESAACEYESARGRPATAASSEERESLRARMGDPALRALVNCPRGEPFNLTVYGDMFGGGGGASILVGGQVCRNTTGSQTALSCLVDGSVGEGRTVLVVQQNGGLSPPAWRSTVAHRPCPAGSHANATALPGGGAVSACVPCAAGRYQPLAGAQECFKCDPGRFSAASASACDACEPGRVSADVGATSCADCGIFSFQGSSGAKECNACPPGTYWRASVAANGSSSGSAADVGGDPKRCVPCPQNADCLASGPVVARSGYWLETGGSLRSFACLPGRCRAGCSCYTAAGCVAAAEGRGAASLSCCDPSRAPAPTNPMCGRCRDGYSEWGGRCVECAGGVEWGAVLGLVAVAWLAVLAVHAVSQTSPRNAGTKIFFFFAQAAALTLGPSTEWLRWVGVLNLDLGDSMGPTCVAPLSARQKSLFRLFAPAGAFALLAATAAAHRVYRSARPASNAASARQLHDLAAQYWRTAVSLGIFSYNSVTINTLSFFQCVRADGRLYVESNPALSCDDDSYRRLLPLYVALTLVCVVGGPLAVLVGLLRLKPSAARVAPPLRATVSGRASRLTRLGILYQSYTPRFYWYEAFSLFRRALLVATAVVLVGDRQAMLTVFSLLVFVFLVVQLALRPYALPGDNTYESASLVVLGTMSISMIEAAVPFSTAYAALYAAVMAAAVVVFVAYFAASRKRAVRGWISRTLYALRGGGPAGGGGGSGGAAGGAVYEDVGGDDGVRLRRVVARSVYGPRASRVQVESGYAPLLDGADGDGGSDARRESLDGDRQQWLSVSGEVEPPSMLSEPPPSSFGTDATAASGARL